MCGLSGQLRLDDGRVDRPLVRRMTERLRHRGPDGSGYYFARRIGLGHRRLAILDVSGGAQPMCNERRTLCLVANNEIYNFVELRRELSAAGATFRTDSDTEVMLQLIERGGIEAIARLEGMFAFALWDTERERLVLARDPFGIKPLYYYQDDTSCVFASELKALMAYAPLDRELNLPALDRYFASLALPDPQTVFKRVRKVPAGHYLTIERGRARLTRYWSPNVHAHRSDRIQTRQAAACLRSQLDQSIERSLRSDVPVGVLLSGGVDSSSIAALAAQRSPRPLQTFSVAFRESDFDESPASRLVARHLGTCHHEITLTKARATQIAIRLGELLDEPFADSSSIPTFAVCALAARYVKTVLSGEGGDELFGGYPWHGAAFRRGVAIDADTDPSRAVFHPADRRRLYSREWKHRLRKRAGSRQTRARHLVARRSPLGQSLWTDLTGYLPSDILFKSDRVGMTQSLEIRVPYLNHPFAEFVMRLPDRLKIRGRVQKYILKASMNGMLPPSIVTRPKRGFAIPMDLWLWQKGEWRDLVYDTIFSARTRARQQFDMDALAGLQRQHDRLERLNGYKLWAVFAFENWQRHFLDRG